MDKDKHQARSVVSRPLARLKPSDPALRAIAEIVHDIDLKDGKFGRPETSGIERLITGIYTVHIR